MTVLALIFMCVCLNLQLFTDVCVEDPHLLCDVCLSLGNQPAGLESGEMDDKQKKQLKVQAWTDLLQVAT